MICCYTSAGPELIAFGTFVWKLCACAMNMEHWCGCLISPQSPKSVWYTKKRPLKEYSWFKISSIDRHLWLGTSFHKSVILAWPIVMLLNGSLWGKAIYGQKSAAIVFVSLSINKSLWDFSRSKTSGNSQGWICLCVNRLFLVYLRLFYKSYKV